MSTTRKIGQHEGPVVIGMDPHKRSVTVAVVTATGEQWLGGGRYEMDSQVLDRLVADVAGCPERTWAVEGCRGAGRVIAGMLAAAGEHVVDVPPRLAARVRALDTGLGRKSDATDARSIALVGTRRTELHRVRVDTDLEILKVRADARDRLVKKRTRTVNQLHDLLTRLIPAGARKDLTAARAARLLAKVRPGTDLLARAVKEEARDLLTELRDQDARIKDRDKQLTALITTTGTTLTTLPGISTVGAARLLADTGDLARFADRNHFASWTGTAPVEASSGDVVRHRLSRKGNRQANRVLHTMAITQLRMNHPPARDYYDRKTATKGSKAAMRCLKRRLSDQVFATMTGDYLHQGDGPERGHTGNDSDSSASGPRPTPALRNSLTQDPSPDHRRTPPNTPTT